MGTKRFPIKLPPWHEKRLIWWASIRGASKTGLAQNLIQAKVEENESKIETMLRDRAKDRGMTVEELKAKLLENAGFDASADEDEND